MTTIRRTTPNDIPALARTLALAFANYPWTRWIVPADDHPRRLEALFTLDLETIGVPHNETWMTDDASAVAVWIPPKAIQTHTPDWARHTERSAPLLGDRLAIADAADTLIAPRRPQEPAWYLATMGVQPDRQRQGLGSAVLRPVLDRCDAEGIAALTDTSSPENVNFYGRLGFSIHAEVAMPDDGPTVWIMWREPAQ